MALTSEFEQRLLDRFDELLNEANELIPKMELSYKQTASGGSWRIGRYAHISEYQALVEKYQVLVRTLVRNQDQLKELISDVDRKKNSPRSVRSIIGNLTGLKDNYEKGFLDDLQELIVADISADYMGQAEALLGEGKPGQYDHVPAAVLCGAVLEDSLRRLCQRQSPPICTDLPNGKPKTMDPLITDLQKENVFKKTKAAQLRSWAQIRNSAAHGKFSDFDKNDVEAMLKGVTSFLADYL